MPNFRVETADSYHTWFFSSLCVRLSAAGDYSWIPVSANSKDRIDISAQYELLNSLVDLIASELLAGNTLNFDLICSFFPLEPILDEVHWETRRANVVLKQAWMQIATDCHLVTVKSKISGNELEDVISSNLCRVNWISSWCKECGLQILTEEAMKLLILLDQDRLLNEMEETIEKSNSYIMLAQLAFQYGLVELFQKCLRIAWDFVLGYGHHKDSTIFDVLDAIGYLSNVNSDVAMKLLERISPVFFNISKFTDGDETRHSKHSVSSMLAKLSPQTAASKYDQELKDGEWYYAEETLERLIENSNLSTPIIKRLYLTGLHAACYQVVAKGARDNNPHATEIEGELEKCLGVKLDGTSQEIHSETEDSDKKIKIDPCDFPPEKFEDLTAALKGKFSTAEFWKSWYTFWVKQGQESNLLKQLVPQTNVLVEKFDDKKCLLDLLYTSHRKLMGKAKAFDLLVAAHNAMDGWTEWYDSAENSIERLKIVAEQYANKIDEFIKRTTLLSNDWRNKFGQFIVPNDKLVYLFTQCGRIDEALQLTSAMVESLEESVRNLQLPTPRWDWRSDDSNEDALAKCLVSRLKLPIPTIKLLVMEQISQLLVDHHPTIEAFLIEDLAHRCQESECVEVLCVFLFAKHNGYIPPKDIGKSIKARSLLSDLLLSNLTANPENWGTYAYPLMPYIGLKGDNHRFEFFQGSHVLPLYQTKLDKEEQKTGIPFTLHYKSEWNNTFKYQPATETRIDYFFGSDREMSTGQFYTQATHRGCSAYLRTLDIAKIFYGMPENYASHLSIFALPIEPAYVGLRPQKPLWLPQWNRSALPDEASLTEFVKKMLADFAKNDSSVDLLALSFPIMLDANNAIDLTVVKVATTSELTSEIKIEERSENFSVGLLLNSELAFELNQKNNEGAISLASVPYPLLRYGHWHSDLESRGFYVPNCIISNKKVIGFPKNGLFCYSIDNVDIGFSSFWYSEWKPIHFKDLRSLCGTYTILNKKNYTDLFNIISEEVKFIYICKAFVLSSKGHFTKHETEVLNFTIRC